MKVSLNQVEIEKVLKEHLSNNGISIDNSDIQYSFTNGRKNKGISVEITIEKTVENSTVNNIPVGPIARTCDVSKEDIETVDNPTTVNPESGATNIKGMFD